MPDPTDPELTSEELDRPVGLGTTDTPRPQTPLSPEKAQLGSKGIEVVGESSESNPTDMTREELKSHLEANEARVEQMTTRIEEKISAMDETINARLGQIDEIDSRMEEREEKLFERVRSSLEEARASREESIGDLREEIGEMRGDFEAVKEIAQANFRNRRLIIGAIILAIALVQVLVGLFIT